MKEQIKEVLSYLSDRLGVRRFSNRFLSNYPKFVRVFNFAVPATMVLALVFGVGVLSWQVISLARPGEVKIVFPENGSTKGANFHARIVLTATQDRNPFNLVFKLDDQVIESRVGTAIKDGESREYNFSSGNDGENLFNHNLLNPGEHTFKIEARTGTNVGQGLEIDTAQSKFKVNQVNNIAALGDNPAKVFNASQLPVGASPRDAMLPKDNFVGKAFSSLFPKASAHSGTGKRHGDLNVYAPPGISVSVGHVGGTLDGCHNGNTNTADGNGVAKFNNCAVSNIGGTSATYNVEIGDTPAGWSVNDVRSKHVTVEWQKTADIHFKYEQSAAPAPAPETPPAPSTPAPTPGAPDTGPVYNYDSDSVPFIALESISATEAKVSAFGYRMRDNIPANYLSEVYAVVDGVKVSSTTAFGRHATQTGLSLPLPNLNDGADHSLGFIAVNGNGKSSTLYVGIKAAGAATPPPPGNSEPVDPSGATGSVEVAVYGHDTAGVALNKDKDATVGATYVSITSADNVGKCDKENGLTDNDRSHTKNFGMIHFKDCPVAAKEADNHAKTYRVSMIIPEGFTPDADFAAKTGAKVEGNYLVRDIHVRKNQETSISFLLVGSNANTLTEAEVVAAENGNNNDNGNNDNGSNNNGSNNNDNSNNNPGPGNNNDDTARKKRNVHVYVVEDIDKYIPLMLMTGIQVELKSVNGSVSCENSTAATGSSGASIGIAVFKNCPLATDGGPKKYMAKVINMPNYKVSDLKRLVKNHDNIISVNAKTENNIMIGLTEIE